MDEDTLSEGQRRLTDIWESNLRILKHEAETPMRGHDEDGQCCLRAKLGVGS